MHTCLYLSTQKKRQFTVYVNLFCHSIEMSEHKERLHLYISMHYKIYCPVIIHGAKNTTNMPSTSNDEFNNFEK